MSAPALRDRRRGGAHDLGVLAEQLDRDRTAARSSGCDAQQLGAGLLVAVVDARSSRPSRETASPAP